MVRTLTVFTLTGSLMMAASPVFAQDPLGDLATGLGQLDPLHILTPGPVTAPVAAPVVGRHAGHHHHWARHSLARHHWGHHYGAHHHWAHRAYTGHHATAHKAKVGKVRHVAAAKRKK